MIMKYLKERIYPSLIFLSGIILYFTPIELIKDEPLGSNIESYVNAAKILPEKRSQLEKNLINVKIDSVKKDIIGLRSQISRLEIDSASSLPYFLEYANKKHEYLDTTIPSLFLMGLGIYLVYIKNKKPDKKAKIYEDPVLDYYFNNLF